MRQMLCLLAAISVGCGGAGSDDPPLTPVSGAVRLDGKPLERATVIFVPVGATKGRGPFGVTDAEGKYSLQTANGGEGAAAGDYVVIVTKSVLPDGSDLPTDADSVMELDPKELIPPIYSDASKSTLKATVQAGGAPQQISFDVHAAAPAGR